MALWKSRTDKSSGRSSGKRGRLEYLLMIGGVLGAIIGIAWIGWRYEKFDSVWSVLQESVHDGEGLEDRLVTISIVNSAVAKGAVCLDGSPPAYFLQRGSGEGANNWLVFIEGGAWCGSDKSCLARSFTALGSSRHMEPQMKMMGIVSSSAAVNPDFYNWNRVHVKYCDGGSLNGNANESKQVEFENTSIKNERMASYIFYRGQRIWEAVMEDLLNKGMKAAKKAFLTGCSAGGLATILHCDQFRDLMPEKATVKCLSDAGFFMNIPDVSGRHSFEEYFTKVVFEQNMFGNFPKSCTSQRHETQCFFPQYLISDMRTPLFILNPAYDSYQVSTILIPDSADRGGSWKDCRRDLAYCSEIEWKVIQGFRDDFLKALMPLIEHEKDGAYIDSCYTHCQTGYDFMWSGKHAVKVDMKVVADWYFERNVTKVIDCPFPCNPTCPTALK